MTAPILSTTVDPGDATFRERRLGMLALLQQIDELLQQAARGGGPQATQRHRARGKLPIRDRIALLLDPDSPFLELSPLAGYQTEYAVGGGMVLGIGVVEDAECVILGNDPTDLGGAMTNVSVRKLMRGLEVARQNRLPYIQFVESAGGDLRGLGAGEDPEAVMRRNLTHFAESGRMFHDITELSGRGIPTISVVFGSSTAGGAYQPGLSDYNIFVRQGAKVFLGGPPLVKVATGEDATDEELGGAEMHADVSGLADYLAEDEHQAIRMARAVVAHLHWHKEGPGPNTAEPEPPRHDPEELLGLMPLDLRSPVDAREIIARITDGSRFEEFKPRYGPTLVTGWADIHGFPVGILANNGVLFSDSSQKAAQFIQLCNQISTPLVFLQHITGYIVGREYERIGIVKHGSQMINALSNSTVPHVTVIVGASYGAGNYGMGGRAFDTRFVFLWPTAKIAIMGPKQMAGVMSIVRREQAARRGRPIDEDAETALTRAVEDFGEAQSLALYATGRVADDGVIDPRDTRTVLAMALSACHSAPVAGAGGYGVFRLVIATLLIANRGEIASRIARTASAMGIGTVAVYAAGDAGEPYVRHCDQAVALPGRTAAETYLNIDALLSAAAGTGADAVHPGYGFLAEWAEFARAVTDAGLIWVGPPPDVIEALGDKLAAKRLMAEVGVPVLPTWQPDDADVRYPVLVKAAAGGGGKGMRIVESAASLPAAVASAQREAEAAFGDGTVFLERYVQTARHVEIQILADDHGGLVHCFERECSIQRRHQKVIEEAPSPAVDDDLRARLGGAALAAAKAAGYRNAGTVEFVLEPSGDFWFLEVNTRLQVEHPVTESVTGLDLVRQQLLLAQGRPLGFDQAQLSLAGHAVEARLYAEDAAAGFLPATGRLVEWTPAGDPEVRWDCGVETGSVVGVEFDPLLAKVIAHAPTRAEASLRLARALQRSRLRGVTTNRDFLVAALRHPEFRAGHTTTDFIERTGVALSRRPAPDEVRLAAWAATLTAVVGGRLAAPVLRSLPPGWRNSVMPPECRVYEHDSGAVEVSYRAQRDGTFQFGAETVRLISIADGWAEFERGDRRHRLHVLAAGSRVWVQGPEGDVTLTVRARFPEADREGKVAGGLTAPMPGKVVTVEVQTGATVKEGQVLMIVEAMKMEHRVTAPRPGRVIEIRARPGDQVAGGDVLVVLS